MMGRRIPQFVPTQPEYIRFDGGIDFDTPALDLKKTYCRLAQNYQLGVNGGYRRTAGYERFDGQSAPSDASYAILNAIITGSYAVGDTLTGGTSGATGVIAAATSTYFVITDITGTFQSAEDLEIAGTPIAVASGAQAVDGAATPLLHAQYRNAAADIYRADITAVPGSGSVLGVVQYNDTVYAFRNNAGNTAAVMHKSTASGWAAVALGRELSFTSGGVTEITEGQTITGATSGATAVLTRVVLQSGSWAAGDAAGRFIFASQTGTFQAENIDVGASLNLASIAGNSSAITLSPNGRYEFVIENFGAATQTRRLYGVSSTHRGFEFDGTVFVPISTGMTSDTPSFLAVHKKHLFFAFGSSVQHSGIGTPYIWTPISGAAELGMGDTITGFMSQPGSDTTGGALVVFARNHTKILYGSSSSDWNLVDYLKDQGGYAYTQQRVGTNTLMLDDRGLTSLGTSANFGNFIGSTLSQRIQSELKTKRLNVKASCVSGDFGEWRIFFNDGYALYVTFNGNKMRGIMPFQMEDTVTCIHASEKNDGSEAIYFGSTNGMVYQMEKGTSFDGDDIEAYIFLAWNASGLIRQNKRYKRCAFECSGEGYSEFSFTYELGYGNTDIPQPGNQDLTFSFSASNWDAFTWDSFTWDGVTLSQSDVGMDGTAENVSLIVRSSSDYFSPATFSGAVVHYIPRRPLR